MVRVSFEDLSNSDDFADVTLAYEDGQQGEAHKVMLSYHKKVLSSVRPNVVDFVREDCNCLPALLPALCLTLFDPRRNMQGAATPSTWSTRMPRVPSSASIYMGPEEGEHP